MPWDGSVRCGSQRNSYRSGIRGCADGRGTNLTHLAKLLIGSGLKASAKLRKRAGSEQYSHAMPRMCSTSVQSRCQCAMSGAQRSIGGSRKIPQSRFAVRLPIKTRTSDLCCVPPRLWGWRGGTFLADQRSASIRAPLWGRSRVWARGVHAPRPGLGGRRRPRRSRRTRAHQSPCRPRYDDRVSLQPLPGKRHKFGAFGATAHWDATHAGGVTRQLRWEPHPWCFLTRCSLIFTEPSAQLR